MFGNDCTGDISGVRNYLDLIEIGDDNWIKGTKGKFKICAKVFTTDSTYGIMNGRISKIQICDTSQEHWGFEQCYLNYDRGWDIRPKDAETVEFMNGLLKALGDDKLTDEELLYYSLYIYDSEEDFANRNRQHKGDFGFKDDAIEEGQWFLTGDDPIGDHYAVFKVISSDGEDEIIEHRPVPPTEQERFTAFVVELATLSMKHGVAIKSIGGVWIFDPMEYYAIEYGDDATSGDLVYIVNGEK